METEIRAFIEFKVQKTFESKIKQGITELKKFALTEGYDDERKAALLAYAEFLEERILDVIDDSYND